MARDTKPNLSNDRFEQFVNETLTLSGTTEIHGILEAENGGIIQINSGGTLLINDGGIVSGLTVNQIDIGVITGETTAILADIGSSTDETVLSFRNEQSNSVASGYVDINLGSNNLNSTTQAWGNIAIGSGNLTSTNATGEFSGGRNIAIGFNNGSSLTGNGNNVMIGKSNLTTSTDGAYNVVMGYGAAENLDVPFKGTVALGLWTAQNINATSFPAGDGAGYSVIIGYSAMRNVGCSGPFNLIIGGNAASCACNIVCSNSLIGQSSGREAANIGCFNASLGHSSFRCANIGFNNTSVGIGSGYFMAGNSNTAVGEFAGFNVGGSLNTSIGARSGLAPDENISLIPRTGGTLLTGSKNTFIGVCNGWSVATPNISDTLVFGNCFNATASNKIYLASKGDIELIGTHHTASSGLTRVTNTGLYYDADYSPTASNDPRWIPDIGYVTGLTSGVSNNVFTGYTASTQITLNDIESDISTLSGQTINKLDSIVGGTDIGIDNTDPLNPIINFTGSTTSVGGSDTNVQFNNAGEFSGTSDFTWTQSSRTLDVNGDISLSGTSLLRRGVNAGSLELGNGATVGSSVNSIAIGTNACGQSGTAVGANSNAQNSASSAFGNGAVATGNSSTALGCGAKAFGNYSVALGDNACALQNNAMALSNSAVANGSSAIAIGLNNEAVGTRATAINGTACGTGSVAIGSGAFANGSTNIAIGCNAQTTNNFDGIAVGRLSRAGLRSTSIGCNSYTTTLGVAIGNDARACSTGSVAIGRSAGNSSGTINTAFVSIGYNANNSSANIGQSSVAVGINNCSIGNCSISIGRQSEAVANDSIAIGTRSCSQTGTAFGVDSYSNGGFAMGNDSYSNGSNTFALGTQSCANAINAFAFGFNSIVTGNTAIGLGVCTRSFGNCSISIGHRACATNNCSIAIGASLVNNTTNSVAIGWSTTSPTIRLAESANQFINGSGGLIIGSGGTGIDSVTPTGKLHIEGAIYIKNQSTPPTPTGGGTLFVSGGTLNYIGSSGTITQIAPA